MRHKLRNTYVPVALDATTGELIRSPKTGFVERQPYSLGGEILVRIPTESTFPGYFKDPVATSKRFARDVFTKGDIWYRTGDALRRTDDGRWFFLDRLGDTYRWKSENVNTAEVGEILGKYPGVVEANVYGVTVPNHEGKAGCAALTIEPGFQEAFDFASFHNYARAQLPHYAVPVFLRLRHSMSHTHNNKQNKVALREEGVDLDKVDARDTILWTHAGIKGYIPFRRKDWDATNRLQVRL
jgi:acyl-CoA synthetase (AMP-forming)/AMP-acid ligase II